ncbi:COP9 signalosome complex subunit 6, partial [Dipsacomyces acuminosporus]
MPVSNISTAAVHPLVLLNISEHTTRLVAQRRKDRTQPLLVCGALLGHQKESGWELFHSFELIFDQPEGSDRREFNYSHFTDRLDQIKKIFPADNFVGWYIVSSSTEVTREIKKLHQQILNFNPSALLLVYNASAASRSVADDDDQEMD